MNINPVVSLPVAASTITTTSTNASPGVFTTAVPHHLHPGDAVVFNTPGTVPTGITAGTTYYVAGDTNFTTTAFAVSDTSAHGIAGTNQINTSSTGTATVTLPFGGDLSASLYQALQLTATGVAIATNTSARIIGYLLRGNDAPQVGQSAVGQSAAVVLTLANGFVYAVLGNNTAVTMGDELQQGANGTLVKRTTGVAVALAIDGAPTNSSGGQIQVLPISSTDINLEPTAQTQTSLTDSTGGTPASTLTATVGVSQLAFPVTNAQIAAAALVSAYKPGYAFKILAVTYAVAVPVTTSGKAATITPSITGVNVTGGVLALTSANSTPLGALVAGSSVTAANTGSATDTITLTGSSVTTFVEGSGSIILTIQNMDTVNAISSEAAQLALIKTDVANLIALLS